MRKTWGVVFGVVAFTGALALIGRSVIAGTTPDPLLHQSLGTRVLDIAILVFREGLECILVLAALTASMRGTDRLQQRPVAIGGGIALLAGLGTWFVAVRIIDSLTESLPALDVQAATGLLAIIVLLVVMNWFFHKVYWTGWISMHTKKRQALKEHASHTKVWWGLALLGFSSVYRESFEIVLFLQSYRLRLGTGPVVYGLSVGLLLTAAVGYLTLIAHRRLPHRRMLVATGVMLGAVLLVMVGEQAQEMQLARWLPTTTLHGLHVPAWMELWFAIYPTAETLIAQGLALVFVLGSYWLAREPAKVVAAHRTVAA